MLENLDKSGRMIGGTLCKACFPYLTLVLLYALGKVWLIVYICWTELKLKLTLEMLIFFLKAIILIKAPNIYKLKLYKNISIVLSRLKMATASQILTCFPRWTHSWWQGKTLSEGAFPGSSTTWLRTLSIRRNAGRRSGASWGTGLPSPGKIYIPILFILVFFLGFCFNISSSFTLVTSASKDVHVDRLLFL